MLKFWCYGTLPLPLTPILFNKPIYLCVINSIIIRENTIENTSTNLACISLSDYRYIFVGHQKGLHQFPTVLEHCIWCKRYHLWLSYDLLPRSKICTHHVHKLWTAEVPRWFFRNTHRDTDPNWYCTHSDGKEGSPGRNVWSLSLES